GALEIHDWGVSLKEIDKPDRIVLDLDPDEGLELAILKAAAQEVREFLESLRLKSFLKSTGGEGPHLLAPNTPKTSLARGEGLLQGNCRCARRGEARPLHVEPVEAHAQEQNFCRLSAQSAGWFGHRALLNAGKKGSARCGSACLGRAQGAKDRRAI